ncbi:MAG: hypothetical protein JW993_09625 [Sedimentisphaerales bacterium]|nr:hypothetical protein [Sedimentisphaerales bacterium]
MTERDAIQKRLEEGFEAVALWHLPAASGGPEIPSLLLVHPDGQKLLCHMKDPEAIAFVAGLVKEKKAVIGYDLRVYCSGIGSSTILGRKLHLNSVVDELCASLGWDASVSKYPHTFEVAFTVEGEQESLLAQKLDEVRRVVLALSLRNRLGFVVAASPSAPRWRVPVFSGLLGIEERSVDAPTQEQLAYVERVCAHPDASVAAAALQDLYSQVSDNARITVGWAAIEHVFDCRARHLLDKCELRSLLDVVGCLDNIPAGKRERLREILRDPNLVSFERRNDRIARNISERTGVALEEALKKVKSLANERGGRVHTLLNRAKPPAQHVGFIEETLWAIIDDCIDGPNPFSH